MSESTISWQSLNEKKKAIVVRAMCHQIGYRRYDNFLRILNVGNPKLIIGHDPTTGNYCRIAPQSQDVITVLMKNYL